MESALDCIIAINHEGKVIEWNPAAEKTFGYRARRCSARDGRPDHPALAARETSPGLARFLATGEALVAGQRVEMTAMHADGREFPVELAITRIQSDGPPMFTGYVRRDYRAQTGGGNAQPTSRTNPVDALCGTDGRRWEATILSWNAAG